MIVKTNAALTSLKSMARQIAKLTSNNAEMTNVAADVILGCFYIVQQSPTMNLLAWLTHEPHRKALKNASETVRTKQGIRALRELIELAISALEDGQTIVEEVEVGPLPVKEPWRLSEQQLIALRLGRDGHNQEMKKRRAASRQVKSDVSRVMAYLS